MWHNISIKLKKIRMQNNADKNNADDSKEIKQKEKMIDPGNEHHHPENIAEPPKENNGNAGHEPGEGENELPDVSGEEG